MAAASSDDLPAAELSEVGGGSASRMAAALAGWVIARGIRLCYGQAYEVQDRAYEVQVRQQISNGVTVHGGHSRVHELLPEEMAVYRQLDAGRIPEHIAVIMDGNGRWAGKRSLKRFFGHQQGAESVQFVVEAASRIDLKWLTLYAFSLENNLRRPKNEVNFLMKLLKSYLVGNVKRMNDNNVRITYIGRTHELPSEVQETMQWAAEATAKNTGTTLTLALNYGARSEMVDAVRSMVHELAAKHAAGEKISDSDIAGEITEQAISSALYTAHMPDPDLVVRTSGELRVSNFLLWQIAYAEIYVTDRLWPDFRGVHLLEAIADYQRRERRYGGLGEGDESAAEPSELVRG